MEFLATWRWLVVIVVILLFSKLILILFGVAFIPKNQVESFVEIVA